MGEVYKCGRCQETKPVSAFSRNITRPSGLHTRCKDCMKSVAEERKANLGIRLFQRHCSHPYTRAKRWASLRRDPDAQCYCEVCRQWKSCKEDFGEKAWDRNYTCRNCLRHIHAVNRSILAQ